MTTAMQAHWVATFKYLGHTARPMGDSDWRTFAGAEPGTLIIYVGEHRVFLLSPLGDVQEVLIDDAGYTSVWAWPAKVDVNTEPDFKPFE